MFLYHNLNHIFNMAEEILIPPENHGGRAMDWTFLEAFPTMELLMASCHESGFKKGRINDKQAVMKNVKKVRDEAVRADLLHDLNALSIAWSPEISTAARTLFFNKWEAVFQ